MLIALASYRARQRVTALLQRDIGWAEAWHTWGPKAGYAEVSEAEFARITHLPGVTKARLPRPRAMVQLPLL